VLPSQFVFRFDSRSPGQPLLPRNRQTSNNRADLNVNQANLNTNQASLNTNRANLNTNPASLNTNPANRNTNQANLNTNPANRNTNQANLNTNQAVRTEQREQDDRRAFQLAAKQYSNPAPPVATRLGWLHPRDACAEFHEVLPPPVRSKCPSITLPVSALLA